MRKIYIASRWQSQKRLRDICERLRDVVEVTSSWIHAERSEEPTAEFFKAHGAPRAAADVRDVQACDWLVLDLLDGRGRRGGMMFEAGLAYGIGKRVVVIGDADCVFTQLFEVFLTWDAFLDDAASVCAYLYGTTQCGYARHERMHVGSHDPVVPPNGRHEFMEIK